MNAFYLELVSLLTASVSVCMPILYGTVGETVTQKSGNMNLGLEGVMLMGAVAGFITGYTTGSPALTLIAAAAAGIAGELIFGFLTITLRCNQNLVGLTLSIFGGGLANFVGNPYMGTRMPDSVLKSFGNIAVPGLSSIPVIGQIFFHTNALVYTSYILVILVSIFMTRTNAGLNLRMVGENPGAADALGININLYKYGAVIFSGILCGIGGVYICLVTLPTWQNDIVNGMGWIALSLVIFTNWNTWLDLPGAVFFGMLTILGIHLQKYNLPISQYFFDMLPYLLTVIIMCLGALRKHHRSGEPEGLSVPYFRESR